MKTRFFLIASLLSVASLLASSSNDSIDPLVAPFKSSGDGPIFFADYTNLKGHNDSTYVEFYLQVYYNQLQFVKDGQALTASYDLELTLFNENDKIVEAGFTHDRIETASYLETASETKSRNSLMAFTLKPGKYTVQITLTDKETLHSSSITNLILARNFETENLMISDIQLSQRIALTEDDGPYVKNKRYIEPHPIRAFGHHVSDIYIYFEIYRLLDKKAEKNNTYTSQFIFHDEGGNKIAQLKRRHEKPGAISAHSMKFPVDYFKTGRFSVTVRIQDDLSGEITEATRSFTVLDEANSRGV